MHVWSNVIWSSKTVHRKEMTDAVANQVYETEGTLRDFFRCVFVCPNTWLLGELKNVEVTLIVLPKWIIENMKKYGQDLIVHSERKLDEVRIWYATFTWSCPQLFYKIVRLCIFGLLFILFFLVLNVLLIALLSLLLLLSLPILVIITVLNLRKGIVVTKGSGLIEILEVPPDINQEVLFKAYPEITLFHIQQGLVKYDGLLNLDAPSLTLYPL